MNAHNGMRPVHPGEVPREELEELELSANALSKARSMNLDQLNHYKSKLAFETDAWDLYEALSRHDPVVVVDGRSAEAYAREHIPGSVNLPHREISAETTARLDKSRLYVCYCDGIGCNASTKTALKLLTLGFQVRELLGGLDWWKRDGYATEGEHSQVGTGVSCGC